MEKQPEWACKLRVLESLGISKVGQTVWAMLTESQIWHRLAGSVRGGFRKGTIASACLDARHFSSSQYATGTFQVATQVLELRGNESEWVSPCVGSLRGTSWGSSSFFHCLNPCWFLQPEVMGTYVPGTGTLRWGEAWCGAEPDGSWIFSHHTWVRVQPVPHLCPSDQSVWIWFNSIVVRLPLNLISNDSEWCLFYILVVILMWLCEELSHVCLRCHLDQNLHLFYLIFIIIQETDSVLFTGQMRRQAQIYSWSNLPKTP